MTCLDYTEWIARMLEGSLPERRMTELEAHLSGCRRCRAELLLQKKIHEALVQELPSGLSADFARRVTEKAISDRAAEKRAQRWANLVPVFAFAVGSALLLVFRTDLARILPALMEPVVQGLAAPVAWIGDAVMGFLARAADVPLEQVSALEVLSRPLVMAVAATLLAGIPTIWAFTRIFAFLRE